MRRHEKMGSHLDLSHAQEGYDLATPHGQILICI